MIPMLAVGNLRDDRRQGEGNKEGGIDFCPLGLLARCSALPKGLR